MYAVSLTGFQSSCRRRIGNSFVLSDASDFRWINRRQGFSYIHSTTMMASDMACIIACTKVHDHLRISAIFTGVVFFVG